MHNHFWIHLMIVIIWKNKKIHLNLKEQEMSTVLM